MLRIATTLCALALSPAASAVCTLARGAPTAVAIPSQVIRINADAAADTSTPIAQFDSNAAGQNIGYDACDVGTEYGKQVLYLTGQDATTRIYQTNIPGIGIKLLWNNGSAFGNFPSKSFITFPVASQWEHLTTPPPLFTASSFLKRRIIYAEQSERRYRSARRGYCL
jgi:hypothetical protein